MAALGILGGLLLAAAGCGRPTPPSLLEAPPVATIAAGDLVPAEPSPPPPTGTPPPAVTAGPSATLRPSSTPLPLLTAGEPCGVLLPLLSPPGTPTTIRLDLRPVDRAQIEERLPAAARPAWTYLLANPQHVALVAYQAGRENQGVYLNPDLPLPVASIVKWLHLVAYAEAVAAGELDPQSRVALAALDRFYLPGSDLRSHQRAVGGLRAEGRVAADETITLEDTAAIMMRYSSNAATDYLHLLLGQRRLEQTALDLGLTSQTAPCPFLGQFLAMSHHGRPESDRAALAAYLADPEEYGQAVVNLALTFSESAPFRAAEGRWRAPLDLQRSFIETLSPRGSAREYAALLARLAGNGLSSPDSSFFARRLAEWPMRFPANQAAFANLAYKDGSLPGVVTLTYYAYRPGDPAPLVVALFFHDLPQSTYRTFRRDLAYDELARWLLLDPQAIPLLGRALVGQ